MKHRQRRPTRIELDVIHDDDDRTAGFLVLVMRSSGIIGVDRAFQLYNIVRFISVSTPRLFVCN